MGDTGFHGNSLVPPRSTKLELVGQRLVFRTQRVIAADLEGLRQTCINRFAVVIDHRGLAMHETFCTNDCATEVMNEALVTKANPKYGYVIGECGDHGERYAGILRATGPWGNNEVCRCQRQRLCRCNRIITVNHDISTLRRERLQEVIGKRIVIVDQQHAHIVEGFFAQHH